MPGSLPPGRRILLVEDDAPNADLACIALRAAGWEVEWVAAGEAAIERALAGGWSAVVLDVLLPGLDGLEVARRLRADPAGRSLPILALSALASAGDRAAADAAGVDAYLTKPYRRQDLVDAVATLVARRGE